MQAQSTSIDFQKTYNFGSSTSNNDFIKTSDGGYLFTGSDFGNGGDGDYSLTKLDSAGDTLWHRRGHLYNTVCCVSWGNTVIETQEGNFLIGAVYYPTPISQIYLLLFNASGNLQWEKFYSLPSVNFTVHSLVNLNSSYLITGFMNGTQNNNFLMKIDNNGDSLWFQVENYTIAGYSHSIAKKSSNEIVLTGSFYDSTSTSFYPQINIIDSNGTTNATFNINDTASAFGLQVQMTYDNNFLLVSRYQATSAINISKIDSVGNRVWSKIMPLQANTAFTCETKDNAIIVVSGDEKIHIFKLSDSGNLIWEDSISLPANFTAISGLSVSFDYKLLISGSYTNGGGGDPTIPFLIRLTDNSLNNIEDQKSSNDYLVYPNPVSRSSCLNIYSQFNKSEEVLTAILVDELGKEILKKDLISCNSRYQITTGNLGSGFYTLILKNRNIKYYSKVIIY